MYTAYIKYTVIVQASNFIYTCHQEDDRMTFIFVCYQQAVPRSIDGTIILANYY